MGTRGVTAPTAEAAVPVEMVRGDGVGSPGGGRGLGCSVEAGDHKGEMLMNAVDAPRGPQKYLGQGDAECAEQMRPKSNKKLVTEDEILVCPPGACNLLGKTRRSHLKN